MRTSSFPSGIGTVSYPNRMCFSREAHTYIKVTTGSRAPNEDVGITFTYDGQSVTTARKTNTSGEAIFPITSILEAFADQTDTTDRFTDPKGARVIKDVTIEVAYGSEILSLALDCVVIGISDREITLVRDQLYPNNAPAARKIAFPVGFSQYSSMRLDIFVPDLDDAYVRAYRANGESLDSEFDAPFMRIYDRLAEGSKPWNESDTKIMITVNTGSGIKNLDMPVYFDGCTEGVLLHWVDKHGFPCLYRWSVESIRDEQSVEDTYTHLDKDLHPFDVENKTLTKAYTLHSRIVEQDLYDFCKSIVGASDIKMFNTATSEWEGYFLTESEAEDGGAPMKDLVIEITKYEYL